MDTPLDFSNFLINRLKVDTLTTKHLEGPTYELMKRSCKNLVEFEYHLEEVFKATIDQLDWVNPKGQQYPHNLLKPLPLIPNNRGRRVIPFEHFINNDLEYLYGGASSPRNMYSKRRIITVIELKIVEWHSYKYLDWITVPRDDDKLYKFKEGDFRRLCIQDIEDMLLLLVQGNLTNLTVKERFAFKVSLKMFTRSIGFIYQNKDKRNRLIRIDELHKFSDGTLTDVRTALDDRLKGIRMQYLPQSIWRKKDKDIAAAMIQAINKRLKTRRIMRSLESQQAATRNRGKAIVNSPQPIYDQKPPMVAEDDETANQDNYPRINRSAGYENQRIGNVAGARETVGSMTVQKSGIQCYNCKEFGHVARECQKLKRANDAAYHREKMLLYQELEAHYMYMAQLQEVSPDAADSRPIFDDEPLQKVSNDDHYNVFAMESEHPEQSESIHDTYPIDQDTHNVIIDSLDMSYERQKID
nr:hypothetical protein [Tanacetum cinerariifolium]